MSFVKKTSILVTGTLIAQVVPITLMPVLTRLYTPESFGQLTLYLSIISILSTIATLRYEFTIVQAKTEEEAGLLVTISFVMLFIITILLSFCLFVCSFFDYLNLEDNNYLFLLPISTFFLGGFNILVNFMLYKNDYNNISYSKILQSGTIGIFQMLFYFFKNIGLIFGLVSGQILTFFIMFFLFKSLKNENISFYSHRTKNVNLWEKIMYYKGVSFYSSLGSLSDSASQQMPVFMIDKFFGNHTVGIFGMSLRILSIPTALVSRAVGQVLYKKVNESDNKVNLIYFVIKLFLSLFFLYLPVCFLIWFYGEDIFAFIFGEAWREVGAYSKVLVISILIRFSISPLSSILLMKQNVKLGMMWQILYLVTMTITLLYCHNGSIYNFLWVLTIHEFILYAIYFVIILIGAKRLQESV